MPRAVLVVLTNPVEGSDEEFNAWYTGTHLSDVLKVEGFVAATRYRIADAQLTPSTEPPSHRYLAIYEVEADDLEQATKGLAEAAGGGAMFISEALDTATASALLYTEITPRQVTTD